MMTILCITGFYRVNYDNTNWQRIINYLNSDKYTKIHVLNRAQIIDDMYYFMKVGKITPQTFFDLIGYLKRETDYIAWYPMKKILSYIFPFAQLSIPESVVVKVSICFFAFSLCSPFFFSHRLS